MVWCQMVHHTTPFRGLISFVTQLILQMNIRLYASNFTTIFDACKLETLSHIALSFSEPLTPIPIPGRNNYYERNSKLEGYMELQH